MNTSQKQLRIEEIKVKDLYEFACQIQRADIVPITRHRAFAHTKNPCADENDIGLLAAFLGKQCVGYLGLLPGLLKNGDQLLKIYWLSTFYVPPEYRKTLAALQLMNKAFELKYDLFLTGISEEAQNFHRKLGAKELGPLEYYEMNVARLNLLSPFRLFLILLNKIGISSKLIETADKVSFRLIKKLFYALLSRGYKDNINCEQVNGINKDEVEILTKQNEFYRDSKIINWMLRNKWVLEDKAASGNFNYQFSSARDVFRYICLKIHDYNGFLVLSISSQKSRTVLKVLDFNVAPRLALKVALKYAGACFVDRIEFPENLALSIKKNFLFRFLLQKRKRTYLYYPRDKNKSLIKNINLNYCDGDIAFT